MIVNGVSLKKFQQGFIDPFSLLSLGFLLVTLVVMAVVTSNPNITQDIRKRARVIEDSGPTVKKPATKTSTTTEPTVTTEPVAPTLTSPEESRLEKKLCLAEGGTWNNNQCQFPETTTPTQPTVAPPITTPTTQVPTNDSSLTPAETRLEKNLCAAELGTWNSSTNQCQFPETTTKPSPTPSPKPTPSPSPTTITKSDYQKCLDTGNTPSECTSIATRIGETVTTPIGQEECISGQKQCSGSNLKICSNSGTWGLQTCSAGCDSITNSCKTPIVALQSFGESCSNNSECESNNCASSYYSMYYERTYLFSKKCVYSVEQQNAWENRGRERETQTVGYAAAGLAALPAAAAITTTGQAIAAYGGVYGSAIGSTLLSSLPTTVQTTIAAVSPYVVPALTIGSTIPAVVQTTQCLAGTGNCEQAQETAFYTAVGLQQMQDYQAMTTAPNQPKTVAQINREIDALVAKGTPELDAITQVGAASVPEYARTPEQIATLQLADKARTADEVLQCQYTWCRQNSIVSDAVLESRGYQPYRAIMTMQTTEGLSAGGHHASAIFVNGEPVFIDFTSNLIIRGPQALEQIFINKGMTLNTLQLSTLTSPWEVINLLP